MKNRTIASRLPSLFLIAVALAAMAGTAAAGEKIKMRFNTPDNDHKNQPAKEAIQMFFDEVAEKSGGRVEFTMYWGGALGSTTEAIFGGLQNGAFEMANINQSLFSEYSNSFMPLDVPYLITTPALARKILSGDIGRDMIERAAQDTGVRVIGSVYMGFRHVSNNVRPINTPEDMKGLKLRVMSNPLHIAGFNALGAAATPIAYSELYTALQQKTVDGQENPIINVVDKKFYEVQKYFTYTSHLAGFTTISMSEDRYQSLPEDIRKIFSEAGAHLLENSFARVLAQESELAKIIAKNSEINEMKPEQFARFRDVILADTKVYEKAMGKEYFDEMIGRIRKLQE